MLKSKFFLLSLGLLCFAVSSWAADRPVNPFTQALQLDPDVAKGKAEFQRRCSQCHGENGWGSYDGEFPQLAGQHRSVIIKQLADIHRGTRSNPKMIPVVIQLSSGPSQLVADIAGYLESMLMNPYPEVGEGENLEVAEAVYKARCAGCHGARGEGDASKFYPLVQGQHYEYMLRELRWLRDGKRKNANQDMVEQIKAMDDRKLASLADYLSRLMPPEERLRPE